MTVIISSELLYLAGLHAKRPDNFYSRKRFQDRCVDVAQYLLPFPGETS